MASKDLSYEGKNSREFSTSMNASVVSYVLKNGPGSVFEWRG